MLIIYDFKLPLIKNNDPSEKIYEDILFLKLSELFENFKLNIKKNIFFSDKKELSIQTKIVKKSLDLRQKEPKIVFKVLVNAQINKVNICENKNINELGADTGNAVDINGDIEGYISSFLLENKIKTKQANDDEEKFFYGITDKKIEISPIIKKNKPVVLIAGMGPAGIFAALELLNGGIRPIIIEKGKPVEQRIDDVKNLLDNAKFNEKSNVVFGEGGAGTFSDGKLTTRKNDSLVSYILDFLVKMGAKSDILTEHKPHLGSDKLITILKNIRNYLIENGAEILYEEELINIVTGKSKDNSKPLELRSIITNKRELSVDFLIIACGSNSYETYELLKNGGVYMEKKPFAMGFRIEHKKDFINNLFFKGVSGDKTVSGRSGAKKGNNYRGLDSVYYNISSKTFGGYSFCMCPGGFVINSSSKNEHLCVNGMSYSERDFENSNSAIVATIRPEILDNMGNGKFSSGMGGLIFRQDIENKAYIAGGGDFTAPYQAAADYVDGVISGTAGIKQNEFNGNLSDKFESFINNFTNNCRMPSGRYNMPKPSYLPKVKYCGISSIFPDFLNISLAGSLIEFDMKLNGFINNSVLTAVEAGTSSAVRIKREDDFESFSVAGLYPCGEGSGYSGGIITSAIDGIKCSRVIINKIG